MGCHTWFSRPITDEEFKKMKEYVIWLYNLFEIHILLQLIREINTVIFFLIMILINLFSLTEKMH